MLVQLFYANDIRREENTGTLTHSMLRVAENIEEREENICV
jgi:hypothetical protein